MNENKILLLGDTHGALGWIRLAIRSAHALGITHILQLGDFGYWPHFSSGKDFWRTTQSMLDEYDVNLWWVDGNHENHDWLADQPRDDDGFWTEDFITHIGRGARWTWGGRTFMGCGGAYSIDKPYRREGESWWAGETITEADLMRCQGPTVDVLVTHDAPWGVLGTLGPETVGDKDDYPESAANRKRVAALCDDAQPELLVHGHYHHRNSSLYKTTRIEGFGRDTDARGSMGVLDLSNLSVTNINPYEVTRPAVVAPVDDDF